jgi:hypothetical protein
MAPKTEEHQKMFVEMVIEDIKNNESGWCQWQLKN